MTFRFFGDLAGIGGCQANIVDCLADQYRFRFGRYRVLDCAAWDRASVACDRSELLVFGWATV